MHFPFGFLCLTRQLVLLLQRVTPWNIHKLREAVENGPTGYPGATHVEDEQGVVTNLQGLPKHKLGAIAKTLLSASGVAAANAAGGLSTNAEVPRSGGKTVFRHLRTGDILLVNRQVSVSPLSQCSSLENIAFYH